MPKVPVLQSNPEVQAPGLPNARIEPITPDASGVNIAQASWQKY
jgi:hypothetical protein